MIAVAVIASTLLAQADEVVYKAHSIVDFDEDSVDVVPAQPINLGGTRPLALSACTGANPNDSESAETHYLTGWCALSELRLADARAAFAVPLRNRELPGPARRRVLDAFVLALAMDLSSNVASELQSIARSAEATTLLGSVIEKRLDLGSYDAAMGLTADWLEHSTDRLAKAIAVVRFTSAAVSMGFSPVDATHYLRQATASIRSLRESRVWDSSADDESRVWLTEAAKQALSLARESLGKGRAGWYEVSVALLGAHAALWPNLEPAAKGYFTRDYELGTALRELERFDAAAAAFGRAAEQAAPGSGAPDEEIHSSSLKEQLRMLGELVGDEKLRLELPPERSGLTELQTRYDRAARRYIELFRDAFDQSSLLYQLGATAYEMQVYSKAKADLETVWRAAPKSEIAVAAVERLASIYYEKEPDPAALAKLAVDVLNEKQLPIDAERRGIFWWYLLEARKSTAQQHLEAKHFEEAAKTYLRASDELRHGIVEQNRSELAYLGAQSYERAGMIDRARESYQYITDAFPTDDSWAVKSRERLKALR